jgi:hypothetical protein
VARRHRVQKAWFFLKSLQSTSDFLRQLFEPFVEIAAEKKDLSQHRSDVEAEEDMDDDVDPFERVWMDPPAELQAALDDRARWLALVRMVGSSSARSESVLKITCTLIHQGCANTGSFRYQLEQSSLEKQHRYSSGTI